MKKIKILVASLLIGSVVYAQQPPTGGAGISRDWKRGGNLPAPPGLGGSNNKFGTFWNSPIYTYTDALNRMTIMGRNPLYPPAPTDGYIGMGDNLLGFTPQDRLHIFQTTGEVFSRYSSGILQGLRFGLLNTGDAQLQHLDDNDIIISNSLERIRVHGNYINQGLNGLVRIGENNGTTAILQDPTLLVTGSVQSTTPNDNYIIAEFRSEHDVTSSAGIKIRGSRNINGTLCAAHIDLSNWDNDEPPGLAGTEFLMSRIGSDMEFPGGQRGNFSIFTNGGTGFPGATGLHQAVYISGDQNVGVGDESVFNTAPGNLPTQRIDVNGNGRFRTLPTLPFMADSLIDKVVMVDSTGVLHWANVNTFGGIGNYCSDPQVPITSDYEIALTNANYYFSKQGNANNAVGIGLPCDTPITLARLQVLQSSANPSFNPGFNIAGQFNNTAGGIMSIGVYADATGGSDYHIAGFFSASGGTTANYGIYASVPTSSGTTPPSGPDYAGYFNGDVYISGSFGPSDLNLKTNIVTIENGLDIINQLNPVNFEYDNSTQPRLNLQNGLQYGLIAQEVETILPEMIGTSVLPAEFDSLGNEIDPAFEFKTLDYEKFIPILIAGMKEQQSTIDSLMDVVEILASCVNDANLCNAQAVRTSSNADPGQTVELTNLNAIILDQNLPNPFAENTIITYSIPDEVMEAQLLFYDMNGRIIKQVEITERGESKMTVYGDNLKNGIYTYSLIADGKLIATKKMVKQ